MQQAAIQLELAGKLRRNSKLAFSSSGGQMQGLYSYNILANPTYTHKYLYSPYSMKDRDAFIVSMFKHPEMRRASLDVVCCVNDLAYMSTAQALAMEFNPVYIHRVIEANQATKSTSI